jgi:hypothetical protein
MLGVDVLVVVVVVDELVVVVGVESLLVVVVVLVCDVFPDAVPPATLPPGGPGMITEPGGMGCGGCPGSRGGRTVVVGWPSVPTLTTVVGVAEADSFACTPAPGIVSGPPGTSLPWTASTPDVAPWTPPGRLGAPTPDADPGPASSARAANAVARTNPLTASTA